MWNASGLMVCCFMRDIDPAALAAEVAGVDDRDVEERREELAALEPALVLVDGEHALEAHVPGELPEQALVGLEQHPASHAEIHGRASQTRECNDQRELGLKVANEFVVRRDQFASFSLGKSHIKAIIEAGSLLEDRQVVRRHAEDEHGDGGLVDGAEAASRRGSYHSPPRLLAAAAGYVFMRP